MLHLRQLSIELRGRRGAARRRLITEQLGLPIRLRDSQRIHLHRHPLEPGGGDPSRVRVTAPSSSSSVVLRFRSASVRSPPLRFVRDHVLFFAAPIIVDLNASSVTNRLITKLAPRFHVIRPHQGKRFYTNFLTRILYAHFIVDSIESSVINC